MADTETTAGRAALSEESARVLAELEADLRADHQYARGADHPIVKRRLDRDVAAALGPVRARLASLEAALAAASHAHGHA